ncbi:hypothetical protein EBT31_15775 [bacterium]|jgi:hypothetical protein|nr:hypothetical protein [bacterium]
MTASIIATPGAADANSYITLAEAQAYADGDIDAVEWYAASTDQRTRALITATRNLDLVGFVGTRSTTTQALAWPRKDFKTTEKTYAADEIPAEIKTATWELAKSLVKDMVIAGQVAGSTPLIPGIPNAGLKRVKLDVMEVEWKPDQQIAVTPLKALPQLQQLLNELILNTPGQTIAITRS